MRYCVTCLRLLLRLRQTLNLSPILASIACGIDVRPNLGVLYRLRVRFHLGPGGGSTLDTCCVP